MSGALPTHLAMVACGIAMMAWGFPASHRLGPPWDIGAALAVLAGVILALFGTLLTAVPGFFSG